jgi:hypothetical protein
VCVGYITSRANGSRWAGIKIVTKKRGVWLGPLTKVHRRRPGPTLWARCEATRKLEAFISAAKWHRKILGEGAILNLCQSVCKSEIDHLEEQIP